MRRAAGFSTALGRSPRAFIRPGGSAARTAGFTLMEVMLAVSLLAAAMEDPTSQQAMAALAFATAHHVLPMVASARGIREAIARSYDLAEDRETVRQLGLDRRFVLRTDPHQPRQTVRKIARQRYDVVRT